MKITKNDLSFSTTARSEITSAAIAIAWAIYFLDPYSNILDSNAAFSPMTQLCRYQMIWGCALLLIGLGGVGGVLFGNKKYRANIMQILTILWAFFALIFAAGDLVNSPLSVIYAIHAVICATSSARLLVEHNRKF